MAYGNFLASVPFAEVHDLRRDATTLLRPAKIGLVSHLVASWIKAEPLAQLLAEALDGGETLAGHLWHPLRVPVVHRPQEVVRLAKALDEANRLVVTQHQSREVGWFRLEIDLVLNVFQYANGHGHSVVSVLSLPMDAERSAKIRIPFVTVLE